MIKNFFVAVILGLLFMSSQLVSAEDYDWSKAPRIGTKAELTRYIESERRKGNTTFRVAINRSPNKKIPVEVIGGEFFCLERKLAAKNFCQTV